MRGTTQMSVLSKTYILVTVTLSYINLILNHCQIFFQVNIKIAVWKRNTSGNTNPFLFSHLTYKHTLNTLRL